MSTCHAPKTRYLVIALLVQTIWGVTPSASRVVLDYLPVEAYAAIRYSVAGLVFLILTLLRHGRLRSKASDLPKLMLLGVVAYGLDSLGTLYGLKLGGVLNFALASSLNAVITAGVAILFLKEKVSRPFLCGAALSVVGGVVLALGKYEVSTLEIAFGSLVLIWGAYVLEAFGFVFSRRFKDRLPLTEYLAILQLSAAAFMWSLALAAGNLPHHVFAMPISGYLSLAFVSLVSCVGCYLLLYWLLNHIEGHKLAFFNCFHTLAAAGLGIVFFDEPFNVWMGIGGGLLIVAVFVVTRKAGAPPFPSLTSKATPLDEHPCPGAEHRA